MIGPLQLAIHVVQNYHVGTQKSHWDKKNKGNYYFKLCLPFVGLAPGRLLRSSMAVLYHVNGKLQRAYSWFLIRRCLDVIVERFYMTSRRPYWCSKTMKRRPCWCTKTILWELNSFLIQTLSLVPMNLHRCWPCEWKRSIGSQCNI